MPAKPAHADRRFLAPGPFTSGQTVPLPPEEAHHLTRVLRLGAGDRITVFDGRGKEFLAEVTTAGRTIAEVVLIEPVEPAREPLVPMTVVQAILKGPAMDDVVRDVTMIGAARIVPLVSAHVAVKATAFANDATADRWKRVVLASAKQCRRATLPDVVRPVGLAAWLAGADEELKVLLVEPSAAAAPRSLRAVTLLPKPRSVAVVVGPEGGWSAEEIALARAHGCLEVGLGSLTLRADAAAPIATALLRLAWEP